MELDTLILCAGVHSGKFSAKLGRCATILVMAASGLPSLRAIDATVPDPTLSLPTDGDYKALPSPAPAEVVATV